jgi:hypothetical protein
MRRPFGPVPRSPGTIVTPATPGCIRNLPQPASAVLIPIVRHGDGAPERRGRRLAESLARRRSRWRANAIPRYAPFPRKRADACRRRRDACPGVIAGVSRADGPRAPAPQPQRLGRRLQIERRSRVDDPTVSCRIRAIANSGRERAFALVALIASLLSGHEKSGGELLLKGATIWGTNMITFGLPLWEFDRGGPTRRREPDPPPRDFQFPQDETRHLPNRAGTCWLLRGP